MYMTGDITGSKIKAIEITKETAKTVWFINDHGREDNSRKQSGWLNFFDTFIEAKDFLMRNIQKKIKKAEYNLEKANLEMIDVIKLDQ